MSSNITPRIDIVFKKIFGVEENKDLLISLINSIVSEEDQVTDVTLLNPYNVQNFKTQKLSILDIKAISCTGKRFNIEIQISDEANYDKRSLFYWAKLYTEQLKSGQNYSDLSKAIGIHILNFTSIPMTKNYHNVFHITEKTEKFAYFEDLELHTIELNKFTSGTKEGLDDIVAKVRNSLDMWSAFLTRNDLLKADSLPLALDNKHLKKAIDVLNFMNFNEEERDLYENHLKWMMIEASTLAKTRAEGIALGKKEGIALGKKEGIALGKEQGERNKAIEVAKNLLSQNIDVNIISAATGLSVQEIKKLL
jgi:predicted transposase/invertase (TIGR01784 family)